MDDGHTICHLLHFGQHVTRDKDCGTGRFRKALNQRSNLSNTDRIQAIRRFVKNDQVGLTEQGSCDGQPLLHSLRVLSRLPPSRVPEADNVQYSIDFRVGQRSEDPDDFQISETIEMRIKGGEFDQAANAGQNGFTIRGEFLTENPNLAGIWFLESHDQANQGCLAGSVLSQEAEDLASPNGHGEAVQSADLAVGFCDLLTQDKILVRIPFDHLRTVLKEYPVLEKRLWETAVETIKETGSTLRSLAKSELLEFSLEQGLVEGNSILVIDLNTCTRCDDCVRACAETHGGRPRFVREGEKYDNFLVTQACYHCQDPVCLVGCPTGAIRRANVSSVVEINEDICIGCGSCGSNCPYDAIVLQDTGQNWGPAAIPKSLRGDRRFVASKCDLCYTSDQGPACVRNCPHGSAVRVGSTEEFQRLLEKEPSS